ncbi:hypothetical protein HYT92_01700 [Candidatus Pacearchaeota archaeon]|nr:hypothetical protein [Candidatus Pacearchaeota archaeon]
MINEFGELIRKKEIEKLSEEIRKLTIKQIDSLWFKCGWIENTKGKNNALLLRKIKRIRKDKKFAILSLKNLLLETSKKEVVENLSEIKDSLF